MDDKKMLKFQELYKESVKKLLTSSEFRNTVGQIVLDYIHNAVNFFNEQPLICSEEELRLFIKHNAPMHLKDAFSHTIDLCIENCLIKSNIH